jgi:hypothetical protein
MSNKWKVGNYVLTKGQSKQANKLAKYVKTILCRLALQDLSENLHHLWILWALELITCDPKFFLSARKKETNKQKATASLLLSMLWAAMTAGLIQQLVAGRDCRGALCFPWRNNSFHTHWQIGNLNGPASLWYYSSIRIIKFLQSPRQSFVCFIYCLLATPITCCWPWPTKALKILCLHSS